MNETYEWQISIIGCGHVGLPLAVCFAERGYKIYLFDKDFNKLNLVAKGIAPFFEPNLSELLKKSIALNRLEVSQDFKNIINKSKVIFIAVETPSKKDGSVNLKAVMKAGEMIGEALKTTLNYCVIALKSTVTPGTTEGPFKSIIEETSGKKAGEDFGLVMQPEFLSEGSAINNVMKPNRIVIGEYDKKSGDVLEKLYRDFYGDDVPPILRMSLASAEIVKYASNAFLAAKISFINQIARLCEKLNGVDVVEVANAIGLDKRIGVEFLRAGAGFGGPCLTKDLKAFSAFSKSLNLKPYFFKAILKANEEQKIHVVDLAEKALGSLNEKKIAILGLAFKPNTDDVIDAPSISIIHELLNRGAKIKAYDPMAMENMKRIFGTMINYANSPLECISEAECCILLTEWDEFKNLKPEDFISLMKNPIIVDARRIYTSNEFKQKVKYIGIGLGN